MKHGTGCSVRCANGGYSHDVCLDVNGGMGVATLNMGKCNFGAREISGHGEILMDGLGTHHQQCTIGSSGASSLKLDTFINVGLQQDDQAWACVPIPPCCLLQSLSVDTKIFSSLMVEEATQTSASYFKWTDLLLSVCCQFLPRDWELSDVQDVFLPSPYDSWDRLQQTLVTLSSETHGY